MNGEVMIERLEGRELFAVSLTPSIPIPPPSPTMSVSAVTSPRDPASGLPTGRVGIIAVLIGL